MHVRPDRMSRARARARARTVAALVAVVPLALLCACGSAKPGRSPGVGAAATLPTSHPRHVVLVMMENAGYDEVIGARAAPYTNSLARRYGLATSSYAVAHPSLPNYLALTSGSTHGISSDCGECSVSAPNIVDQLESAHVSWRAYMESMPQPCFRGEAAGPYAKKHDPFMYYRDVAGSATRCRNVVGFTQLGEALRAGDLPRFSWISPNLCNDGHDCGLAAADAFLARTLPQVLGELGPHGLLVLTWDEGSSGSAEGCCGAAHGGHVATIVAGPDVIAGARDAQPLDSYGVLGTIERALGLPPLGGAGNQSSGRLAALLRGGVL